MCTYISVHELMYVLVLVLVHDNVQCTHVCVNIHTLTYRYTVNMFMKMVIYAICNSRCRFEQKSIDSSCRSQCRDRGNTTNADPDPILILKQIKINSKTRN